MMSSIEQAIEDLKVVVLRTADIYGAADEDDEMLSEIRDAIIHIQEDLRQWLTGADVAGSTIADTLYLQSLFNGDLEE